MSKLSNNLLVGPLLGPSSKVKARSFLFWNSLKSRLGELGKVTGSSSILKYSFFIIPFNFSSGIVISISPSDYGPTG